MIRKTFINSVVCVFFLSGLAFSESGPIVRAAESEAAKKTENDSWKPMFNGKTLENWAIPSVGGEGPVEVKDDAISLGMGVGITGIRYEKEFPKTNYEIRYEAMRSMGTDFFGAVTFPVKDAHCTFVNGGWGGGTIGLSSIDGHDASDNQTSGYHTFKSKTWYQFRVRVTDGKIVVWIKDMKKEQEKEKNADSKKDAASNEKIADDPNDPNKPVVDFVIEQHKISLRNETNDFKPLGFATWTTVGLLRKIEYRLLTKEEIEQSQKEANEYIRRFSGK